MAHVAQKIADQALSLPSNERLTLVEKLLESLNLPLQSEIDRLWAEESERRVKELEEDKVQAVPGQQVFNEIRERLKI